MSLLFAFGIGFYAGLLGFLGVMVVQYTIARKRNLCPECRRTFK